MIETLDATSQPAQQILELVRKAQFLKSKYFESDRKHLAYDLEDLFSSNEKKWKAVLLLGQHSSQAIGDPDEFTQMYNSLITILNPTKISEYPRNETIDNIDYSIFGTIIPNIFLAKEKRIDENDPNVWFEKTFLYRREDEDYLLCLKKVDESIF